MLNGAADPPVYVDLDSNGAHWSLQASTFSAYLHACVWDHKLVLDQPVLFQAQSAPLSSKAVMKLRECFSEQPPTFGWPGQSQHRFLGTDHAVLIRSEEDQADWFVGARDAASLEAALRFVWGLDEVGQSLYSSSEIGETVLERIRGDALRRPAPGRDRA